MREAGKEKGRKREKRISASKNSSERRVSSRGQLPAPRNCVLGHLSLIIFVHVAVQRASAGKRRAASREMVERRTSSRRRARSGEMERSLPVISISRRVSKTRGRKEMSPSTRDVSRAFAPRIHARGRALSPSIERVSAAYVYWFLATGPLLHPGLTIS